MGEPKIYFSERTLDKVMSKNKRTKRNEELEAFYAQEVPRRKRREKDGVYSSFKDIIPVTKDFELKFKNVPQRLAFSVYQQHDILFMLGPAGTGKSHLACMFAIHDIVKENKDKIVLTRPIVEAGESLGYLPGTFSEKTDPYMLPLYDCISKIAPGAGNHSNGGGSGGFGAGPEQQPGGGLAGLIKKKTEVAPLAYMRGRTFENSVCILDEAQNCTFSQLLLFLSRLGDNSKMIITGDHTQTDIGRDSGLMDVFHRLEGVEGIGQVTFSDEFIVRHRLVSEITKRLQRSY
jgi:phosphate starvation-inducible PhoH-like protein